MMERVVTQINPPIPASRRSTGDPPLEHSLFACTSDASVSDGMSKRRKRRDPADQGDVKDSPPGRGELGTEILIEINPGFRSASNGIHLQFDATTIEPPRSYRRPKSGM
jgi:hypothetical protein